MLLVRNGITVDAAPGNVDFLLSAGYVKVEVEPDAEDKNQKPKAPKKEPSESSTGDK